MNGDGWETSPLASELSSVLGAYLFWTELSGGQEIPATRDL